MTQIPFDLMNLLLFTMPGFFFIWTFSHTKKSDFEYLMFSLFWGILLMIFWYKIFPVDKFSPILNSPYAGAIIFSTLAVLLGWLLKFIKNFFLA